MLLKIALGFLHKKAVLNTTCIGLKGESFVCYARFFIGVMFSIQKFPKTNFSSWILYWICYGVKIDENASFYIIRI